MTTTSAEIIADSITPQGTRLTTFVCTFHRFILAEVNTHRVLSRNSASSRAVPVSVTLERGLTDPAIPVSLPGEVTGMQGGIELDGLDRLDALMLLDDIRTYTIERIQQYVDSHPKELRLHKSVLNRPMEWFQWQTAVISATEWDNFFALRAHPAAQPEFQNLAYLMQSEMEMNTPEVLYPGDWHTPFWGSGVWTPDDGAYHSLEEALKTSAARCAWVSTLKHGKKATVDDINDIFNKLTSGLESGEPVHASPFEHQATPASPWDIAGNRVLGNFRFWHQLRHSIEIDSPPWEDHAS